MPYTLRQHNISTQRIHNTRTYIQAHFCTHMHAHAHTHTYAEKEKLSEDEVVEIERLHAHMEDVKEATVTEMERTQGMVQREMEAMRDQISSLVTAMASLAHNQTVIGEAHAKACARAEQVCVCVCACVCVRRKVYCA